MDIAAIGSLLGGIGQAAGGVAGLFNQGGGSNNSVQQTMMQNWRNDDLKRAQRNEEMAYEFAKNGIRWRVEDAKAAGIHPLAALGFSGASSAPISISGGYQPAGDYDRRGSDIGASLANMGQGIGRAMAATQTKVERQLTAYELMRQEQQIRSGDLDIAIKAAQLDRMTNPAQIGPGMPSNLPVGNRPGATGTGVYENKPHEVHTADPNHPAVGAGPSAPSTRWVTNPSGSIYSLPPDGVNMDEFSSPGYINWVMNNKVLPYFSQERRDQTRPSKSQLPPGAVSWSLGPGGNWYPVYPDIPNKDRFGHLGRSHYQFY